MDKLWWSQSSHQSSNSGTRCSPTARLHSARGVTVPHYAPHPERCLPTHLFLGLASRFPLQLTPCSSVVRLRGNNTAYPPGGADHQEHLFPRQPRSQRSKTSSCREHNKGATGHAVVSSPQHCPRCPWSSAQARLCSRWHGEAGALGHSHAHTALSANGLRCLFPYCSRQSDSRISGWPGHLSATDMSLRLPVLTQSEGQTHPWRIGLGPGQGQTLWF